MLQVWTAEDDDGEALARRLETHLNEFADHVLSVSYSVAGKHHVMAVYHAVEPSEDASMGVAVSIAEEIVADAQD